MARLLLDEDVDVRLAWFLAPLGHDVVTVSGLGRYGDEDVDVFAFAARDNRAIVSRNRSDFYALHAADSSHSAVGGLTARRALSAKDGSALRE